TPGGGSPLLPSPPRTPGTPASAGGDSPKTTAEGAGAALGLSAAATSVDPFDKSNPASSSPPPLVGENSLYRIAPDGTVRELFREKALVLSLLRENGHIFIGTGMEGQLFEVDETTKERSEIARLDQIGRAH